MPIKPIKTPAKVTPKIPVAPIKPQSRFTPMEDKERSILQRFPGFEGRIDFASLQDVRTWRKRFEEYIVGSERTIKNLEATYVSLGTMARVSSFISDYRAVFKEILIRHVLAAFAENQDLDYPTWHTHLINRIRGRDEIISVEPLTIGDGDNIKVTGFYVNVMDGMKAVLGTAGDYADVVKIVRSELHYGNKIGGSLATHLWYTRLWLPGRGLAPGNIVESRSMKPRKAKKTSKRLTKDLKAFYKNIMRSRLEEMNLQAPFWGLLDSGIINYTGGKGGYAKPAIHPTWFVANAEKEIKDWCTATFKSADKSAVEQDIQHKLDKRRELLNSQMYVRDLLKDLEVQLSTDTIYNKKLDVIITNLNLAFSEAMQRSSESKQLTDIVTAKIELLAAKMIAEENIGKRIYLWTSQRTELRRRTALVQQNALRALKEAKLSESNEGVIKLAKESIAKLQTKIKTLQREGRGKY